VKSKILVAMSIAILMVVGSPSTSLAAVPFAGWGYSFGNAIVGVTPWSPNGSGWWDPPSQGAILSGQLTLKYDPSDFQILDYGWFGAFGADPSVPAPSVINGPPPAGWYSTWDLQAPNSGMTANVSINNTLGLMVVDFNWGPGGYTPPTPSDFNFFGYIYSVPVGTTTQQLQIDSQGAPGPGKIVLVGNGDAAEIMAEGTNAPTYLVCSGGYCGDVVPEPATWRLFLVGFGVLGLIARALRRKGAPSRQASLRRPELLIAE
jgi:hypothetical protein